MLPHACAAPSTGKLFHPLPSPLSLSLSPLPSPLSPLPTLSLSSLLLVLLVYFLSYLESAANRGSGGRCSSSSSSSFLHTPILMDMFKMVLFPFLFLSLFPSLSLASLPYTLPSSYLLPADGRRTKRGQGMISEHTYMPGITLSPFPVPFYLFHSHTVLSHLMKW